MVTLLRVLCVLALSAAEQPFGNKEGESVRLVDYCDQSDQSKVDSKRTAALASNSCSDLPDFAEYFKAVRPRLQLFDELITLHPATPAISEYSAAIQPYLNCEPMAATVLKRPTPLLPDCSDTKLFTGRPRGAPAKIWDINPFSCELDVLEMRLFELEGIVDIHVITESPYTHRLSEKGLCYIANKNRFARFAKKIKVR